MEKLKMCICPICHKAFSTTLTNGRQHHTVCSADCRNKMAAVIAVDGKQRRDELLAEAKKLEREPRKTCIMYEPISEDCVGLTGLWCTVEDCKFYKPKC